MPTSLVGAGDGTAAFFGIVCSPSQKFEISQSLVHLEVPDAQKNLQFSNLPPGNEQYIMHSEGSMASHAQNIVRDECAFVHDEVRLLVHAEPRHTIGVSLC